METNLLNEIDFKWVEKSEKRCLRIAIHGHFNEKNAKVAVSKWREEIFSNIKQGEKVNIICNCSKMTRYDPEARKLWQQTINELKSQIDHLWIISNNKLFKTAAVTMGFLTKFKIRTADSESEICIK